MTALTAPADARETHIPLTDRRLSFARVLRSEWIKLATLRSTWWSIGIVALLTVGIALLLAGATNTPGFPAIQIVVAPIQFTMLLAGILGAIAITGEYSTGMIRSTLTADPHRGAVLAAKAVVVAVVMFVSSLVIFLAAAAAVSPILAGKSMDIPWGEPADSMLPILAAAASMSVFALIGLAFGFIIRNGPGAIAATVGLLFVLPIVTSIFPYSDPAWQWIRDIGEYLPMTASQSFIMPRDDFGLSGPAAGATLAAWTVAGLAGGWAVLRSRDA